MLEDLYAYLVLFGEVTMGFASDPEGHEFNSKGRIFCSPPLSCPFF